MTAYEKLIKEAETTAELYMQLPNALIKSSRVITHFNKLLHITKRMAEGLKDLHTQITENGYFSGYEDILADIEAIAKGDGG